MWGARSLPLQGPAPKQRSMPAGDYTLLVHVIEATNLAARDGRATSDPYVLCTVGGAQQRTHVKSKCITCTWGSAMAFDLRQLSARVAASEAVHFELRDADNFSSDLIGSTALELPQIWAQADHAMWHSWLALFSKEAAAGHRTDGSAKGYLRVSVVLIGPGRGAVLPVEPARDPRESGAASLIAPPIKVQMGTLCLDVIDASGLMPLALTRAPKLRIVLALRYNDLELRTQPSTVSTDDNPSAASWEVKLRMPVATNERNDRVVVCILDDATGGTLAFAPISLSETSSTSTGLGSRPTFRQLQLYGAARGSRAAVAEAMAAGGVPATAWRGHVMCRIYRKSKLPKEDAKRELNDVQSAAGSVAALRMSVPPLMASVERHKLVFHVYGGAGVPGSERELVVRVQLAYDSGSTSAARPAGARAVEWNERIVLNAEMPEQPGLQPDLFVYLQSGAGALLAVARLPVAELGPPMVSSSSRGEESAHHGAGGAARTGRRADHAHARWLRLQPVDAKGAPVLAGAGADGASPASASARGLTELLVQTHFGPHHRHDGPSRSGPLPEEGPALVPSRVRVRLHAADGLLTPPGHHAGMVDAFAVLRCLGQSAQSARSSTRAQSASPGWFETLTLELPLPERPEIWPYATLDVYTVEAVVGSRLIGSVTVDLAAEARAAAPADGAAAAAAQQQQHTPSWYALHLEAEPLPPAPTPPTPRALDARPGPLGSVLAHFAVEPASAAESAAAAPPPGARLKLGDPVGSEARARARGGALFGKYQSPLVRPEALEVPRVRCVVDLGLVGLRLRSAAFLLPQFVHSSTLDLEAEISAGPGPPVRQTMRFEVDPLAAMEELLLPCELPADPTLCPALTVRLREPLAGGILGGARAASATLASATLPLRGALAAALTDALRGRAPATGREAGEVSVRLADTQKALNELQGGAHGGGAASGPAATASSGPPAAAKQPSGSAAPAAVSQPQHQPPPTRRARSVSPAARRRAKGGGGPRLPGPRLPFFGGEKRARRDRATSFDFASIGETATPHRAVLHSPHLSGAATGSGARRAARGARRPAGEHDEDAGGDDGASTDSDEAERAVAPEAAAKEEQDSGAAKLETHQAVVRRHERQAVNGSLEDGAGAAPTPRRPVVRPPYLSATMLRAAVGLPRGKGEAVATVLVATLKYTLQVRVLDAVGPDAKRAPPSASTPTTNPIQRGLTLRSLTSRSAGERTRPVSVRAEAVLIRVYVLSGQLLLPRQRAGALHGGVAPTGLHTFLSMRHGGTEVRTRERLLRSTFEPLYHEAVEFEASFPGSGLVRLAVVEAGAVPMLDDEIGYTEIDVEDRWFSPEWRALKLKPIERRMLYRQGSPFPQGALELFVDVLRAAEETRLSFAKIPLPAPEDFELRLVVFETRTLRRGNVVRATDAYFRVALRGHDGAEQLQESDVHYGVLDGNARFNWRFKYSLRLPLGSRRSLDGIYLDLQVWDHALTGEGEMIAGSRVNLSKLARDAWLGRDWLKERESSVKYEKVGQRLWLGLVSGGGAANVSATPAGDVAISIQLMPAEVAAKRPAGFGRDQPNRNPVLPEPARSKSRAVTERLSAIVREEVAEAMRDGAREAMLQEIERRKRQLTPEQLHGAQRYFQCGAASAVLCLLALFLLQLMANLLVAAYAFVNIRDV